MTKRVKSFNRDSFVNFLTRTGIGTPNLSSGNSYGFNPVSRNRQLLEWMYRGSWICGVAVDCVADDMTREGITFNANFLPDQKEKMEGALNDYQVMQCLNLGEKWGRLYGGALVYIDIDGQNPATPLRIETVGEGQFRGLIPMDQWMVVPDITSGIKQPGPDFGLPEFYEVVATSFQFPLPSRRIHCSRVVRLIGIELPFWQKQAENMWGISILERVYDRLTAFDSTTQGAAQLVYRAYLRTYSVEDLREIIAAGGKAYEALVKQVELTRLYQSNEGMTLMDSKDKFEAHNYTFSGLSDVLGALADQISGATQIPLARLFGQSPSGLNATGDHDLRTYYDNIKRLQERWFRRPLDVIIRVIAASRGITLPQGLLYDFNSLWQMTDKEQSEIDQADTTSVTQVQGSGAIGFATMLKELRARGRKTNRWTEITDEDIKEAEEQDAAPPASELLGGEEREDDAAHADGGKVVPFRKEANDRATITDFKGLPLHIETRKDAMRYGPGWQVKMPADYGYIVGVGSAEGPFEELDCYVGDNEDASDVYVIDQQHPDTRKFDEHKVMLGFNSLDEAIRIYDRAFSDGKGMKRIGSVTPMTLDEFKKWTKTANLKLSAAE